MAESFCWFCIPQATLSCSHAALHAFLREDMPWLAPIRGDHGRQCQFFFFFSLSRFLFVTFNAFLHSFLLTEVGHFSHLMLMMRRTRVFRRFQSLQEGMKSKRGFQGTKRMFVYCILRSDRPRSGRRQRRQCKVSRKRSTLIPACLQSTGDIP